MTTENPQQSEDVPHEDELDIEGPNESGPGHNPSDDDAQDQDD